MATLPYVHFDKIKPDATVQTLAQMGQSMLSNQRATRDASVMGAFPDWNGLVSGGTALQPAITTHSNGTERIRETYTWASGKLASTLYDYSSDSGVTWVTVRTLTYSFDGVSGAITSWNWS